MSFTVKILTLVKKDSGLKVTVKLTDGSDVRTESYLFTGTTRKQLKNFIRAKATRVEDIKDIDFSDLVGKEFDLTPDPVVVPDPPTPEEIAKAEWFKDYRKLKQMLELTVNIPALATAQTNTAIDNLLTSLEAGWLNSYLGDI